MMKIINKDREELSGSFCRGCGYCLPCPVCIEIPIASRITLFIKRMPYELDTPNLLKRELKKYREFYETHKNK
jgi:hypothetical protein